VVDNTEYLNLDIDFNPIKSHEDYQEIWKRFSPVEVRMIEKNEDCLHRLADTFIYNNHYDKPHGICSALHHVLQLYIWRASLGFPSWEKERNCYRIHCPDKKGTVWEVKRASAERP